MLIAIIIWDSTHTQIKIEFYQAERNFQGLLQVIFLFI